MSDILPTILIAVIGSYLSLSTASSLPTSSYSTPSSTSSQVDEFEIQQFNSKFQQFEGDSIRGTSVNVMLQTVVANNLSRDDDMFKVEVVFEGFEDGELPDTKLTKNATSAIRVNSSDTYKVACLLREDNIPIVSRIVVTKN